MAEVKKNEFHCEICNLQLDKSTFPDHVLGKRHMKNVEAKEFKNVITEKSIFVSNMPAGITETDILKFFSRFGHVVKCKYYSAYAIVEFQEKNTVDSLLRERIFMGRCRLDIKRRKFFSNNEHKFKDQPKTRQEPEAETPAFAELKTALQSAKTIDEEIETFIKMMHWRNEDVEKEWVAISASLQSLLKPVFPACEVTRFGTSVTGLCLKDSDFDIYLAINERIYEESESELGWTQDHILRKVKTLFYRKKNLFDKIVPIPRCRTPIIKFNHIPTGRNCDISFKHGLGVINSHLIKNLVNLDPRLHPLMLIITFWAKTFGISGCGKFTNYSIVMLVIFYLQQPDRKILPTITELRGNGPPHIYMDWRVDFDFSALSNNAVDTRSTVKELLTGFFKFYTDFPFETRVISLVSGQAYDQKLFRKVYLPQDPKAEGFTRPICVQDPIEFNTNITVGVKKEQVELFMDFCAVGLRVCEASENEKTAPTLLNLFTTLPEKRKKKECYTVKIQGAHTLKAGNICLKEHQAGNSKQTQLVTDGKVIEENWFKVAEDSVKEILKRVFKMNVVISKEGHGPKQQKVAETSDVHTKQSEKQIFECSGEYLISNAKLTKSFCIDPSLGPIDKEEMLADEMLKEHTKNGVKLTKYQFLCTFIRERSTTSLILTLENRNTPKKSFEAFAARIATKLPSIINKELMHIIQFKIKSGL